MLCWTISRVRVRGIQAGGGRSAVRCCGLFSCLYLMPPAWGPAGKRRGPPSVGMPLLADAPTRLKRYAGRIAIGGPAAVGRGASPARCWPFVCLAWCCRAVAVPAARLPPPRRLRVPPVGRGVQPPTGSRVGVAGRPRVARPGVCAGPRRAVAAPLWPSPAAAHSGRRGTRHPAGPPWPPGAGWAAGQPVGPPRVLLVLRAGAGSGPHCGPGPPSSGRLGAAARAPP